MSAFSSWAPSCRWRRPAASVLVVDQFEELFTLQTPERRRQLIDELAALVRGRMARGEEGAGDERSDAAPPDLKIVLALREDFLADLEELARDIPAILHHRFCLGPLTRDGARAAVVEPARLEEKAFDTPPFAYREAAVEQILGFLARRRHGAETVAGDDVEPAQLQLICQYLEEKVRAREAGADDGELTISAADIGGERHMRRVLESFYDRTLAAVWPPGEVSHVRKLCEKGLIIPGSRRRRTEDEEEIARKYKVSKQLLRQLVDARLLRSEPRLGGAFYELSHDTLVEPILESRKRRVTRYRRNGVIVAGIALISFGLLGWGRTRDAIRSAQRSSFLQQLQPAAPDVVFSAFWSLVHDYGEDPAEIGGHLRLLDLRELFERGPARVPAAQRGEAVLRVFEVVQPTFADNPGDLRAIAAATWALDAFAGRDRSLTDTYRAARDAVLAPLREQRADPELSLFDWVEIPAGRFRMGSEAGDSDERPVHEVELSAFRMLAHEVTNAEYRRFDPSHQGPHDHPAVGVDWYRAYAYAAWLGGRLPTEAEWEYAARAECAYACCDRDGAAATLDQVGWTRDHPKFRGTQATPQPVEQLAPNPWGLYDMYGNVWEWTADWYGPYSPGPQADPWGPPSGVLRVIRGGSYGDPALSARAANRDWGNPVFRNDVLGFRVVLPAAPSDG